MAREARDAYFTPDETALRCVEALYEHEPELEGRPVVEPSAGGGAFLRALAAVGKHGELRAYDLEPMAPGIERANFLEDEIAPFEPGTVVIGNPPYGIRNALSIRFIKRSFELGADRVAFLLMETSLKHSILNLMGHRVIGWWSSQTSFVVDGSKVELMASRAIWIVFSKEELQPTDKEPFRSVSAELHSQASFSSSILKPQHSQEIDLSEPSLPGAKPECYYHLDPVSGRHCIADLYQGDPSRALELKDNLSLRFLGGKYSAPTLNWLAEHGPSLYRGAL